MRTWEESCSDKDDDSTQIANPASQYCVEQGGESKIITAEDGSQSGVCVFADGSQCDEWAYFRGECPKCPVEQVICVEGSEVITYTGDNGCKHTTCKARTYCKPDQRGENIACTMEYMPVCGWFNQSIQCVKYPCAATYGNKCTACADSKVAYWTEGECPE
ncbi:DUF333 domain-containing protein [Candidatus Woesearchaeota archaeon]|nr:DUF333 domain-containing protein [Candidatus Woesearchaeota archaeon]